MILGKYEIQESLGQGGFGTVYKALDISLKRPVAVKVLHPNLVNDQTFLGRFRQEAQITAQLDHCNLVTIYDYDENEGHYYIVMSYMPGGSLKERIKNEAPFSKEAALSIIEQIGIGLEYSHKRHVIHRDLKPGNILFDEEGNARISDLGFAKLLHSDASTPMSVSGGIVGTPSYMAPEIWLGYEVSPATDIYSLACIMVEMLTGERLFGGERAPEVMLKHFEPLQLPESLPEEWKAVLKAALEKKPEDRIQSARDFLEQLKQADQGESLPDKKSEAIKKPAIEEPSPDYDPREVQHLLQRLLDSHPGEMVFEPDKDEVKPTDGSAEASANPEALINEQDALDGDSSGSQITKEESLGETENREKGKRNTKSDLFVVIGMMAVIFGLIIYSAWKSSTSTAPATRVRQLDGMERVYVPAGNFIMGSKAGDPNAWSDEKPERTVYLDAYWIDKYEVNNGQYQQCVEAGKCTIPHKSYSTTRHSYYGNLSYDNFPVIFVAWHQAKAYCEWVGGDLPTEAQWEKAARGTDGREYPWGNQEPDYSYANYWGNAIRDTDAVKSYEEGKSPYGVMNMSGNVSEWVNDWYADKYDETDNTNPQGPDSGNNRAVRGGSFVDREWNIQSADRMLKYPNGWYISVGFRCVSKP